MKARFAVLILLVVTIIWSIWHGWLYSHYELVKGQTCGEEKVKSYELRIDREFLLTIKSFDEKVTCGFFAILTFFIVVLFVKLRRAIRRIEHEHDDSIVLVFLTTLMFFISEGLYASWVFYNHVLLKRYYTIQWSFIRYRIVSKTVISICYVTHCFVCMISSYDYWEACKKIFRRKKGLLIPKPDAGSISTVRTSVLSNTGVAIS
ncbi:hypothetical protein CAEBREN_29107 [Caenorhabditis brenneri]|uniref:G-protein coupled receptors family 1 profile domain-containing protein n=1 Tax=Caenorhabditis brenneri TaxID=135651 RepID=G0MUB8_CAEBE|nr:hypothetical protein CAEBREN_29107 [Caenorhabditis brenneri]